MRRQNGQAMVEFAFMTPLMCMMIFGLIYGAVIFMDYLNFSNDARAVARRIAVVTDENDRKELIDYYNRAENSQFARFYTVTRNVYLVDKDGNLITDEHGNLLTDEDGNVITSLSDSVDVMVMVSFDRNNNDVPGVLVKWTNFPPAHFAIKYTMKLEKTDTSGSEG